MQNDQQKRSTTSTVVSMRSVETGIIETLYQSAGHRTQLAKYRYGAVSLDTTLSLPDGQKLEPIPATNNLIRHGAVVFPEKPEDYGAVDNLVRDIDAYIYRYLDVSDQFRKIATWYVLLTWVYDAFNEVPYLRLRGDFGSGKTRALFVIGSIAYKAFFASGASTVSPIFHTLDTFRGTLIFDEADFRFSDEKSELVKIFNNGNVRGFPVLRTAITAKKEFDPRAFNVFGPKIVAMRKAFEDQALESRFLTEEMGQRTMRRDIPINLPDAQKEEALSLRNRLLMYRFKTLDRIKVDDSLVDPSLSPRLNQILVPLLSIIEDDKLRDEIREAVQSYDEKLYAERASSIEASVLEVIHDLYARSPDGIISLSSITTTFASRFCGDFDRPITIRGVGNIVRRRLRLLTYKRNGIYVIPASEKSKVDELCIRHGVVQRDHVESVISE
jgi:hypothetical protein